MERKQSFAVKVILLLTVFSVCFFVINCEAQKEINSSSQANALKELFLKSDFTIVTDRKGIHSQLLLDYGIREFIANPDESYNSGCSVYPPDSIEGRIPKRRLVFAGQSQNLAFMVLDNGGIAITRVFSVMPLSDSISNPRCDYYVNEEVKDLGSLKDFLSHHPSVYAECHDVPNLDAPGKTTADMHTREQIIGMIIRHEKKYAPDCALKIIDVKVTGKKDKTIYEDWAIDSCGQKIVYPFHLTPNSQGTTSVGFIHPKERRGLSQAAK